MQRLESGGYYSPDTYKLSTFYCPFPFRVGRNGKTDSTFAFRGGSGGGRGATWVPWVGAIRLEKSRPDKWCCVWLRSFLCVCMATHTHTHTHTHIYTQTRTHAEKNAHYHTTLYLSLIISGAAQMVTYPWQRLTSHSQTFYWIFLTLQTPAHVLSPSLSGCKTM